MRKRVLVFCGFSLVSGSLWLLPADDLTSGAQQVCFCVAALLVCLGSLGFQDRLRRSARRSDDFWRVTLLGAATIGVPALLFRIGGSYLNGTVASVAQASIPVVVAVTLAAWGTEEIPLQDTLLPVLLALAGILLLLPVALPHSSTGWWGMALYLLAAGVSGVCGTRCYLAMRGLPMARALFAVALGNAVFATASCGLPGGVWPINLSGLEAIFSSRGCLLIAGYTLDLVGLYAVLYAVPPLGASARFIAAPLVSAVEASLLLRPTLSARMLAGGMLMLAGTILSLRFGRHKPASAE